MVYWGAANNGCEGACTIELAGTRQRGEGGEVGSGSRGTMCERGERERRIKTDRQEEGERGKVDWLSCKGETKPPPARDTSHVREREPRYELVDRGNWLPCEQVERLEVRG